MRPIRWPRRARTGRASQAQPETVAPLRAPGEGAVAPPEAAGLSRQENRGGSRSHKSNHSRQSLRAPAAADDGEDENMNTERSQALFARAQALLPGGVNSPVRAFK